MKKTRKMRKMRKRKKINLPFFLILLLFRIILSLHHIMDMSNLLVVLQILHFLFHHHKYIHKLYIYISFYSPPKILSANFSICSMFSCFIVDLMVTDGSIITISFIGCKISFIVLAADGAQEPFSKMAIFLF